MKTLSDPIILSFFLIRGSCRRATRTCSRSAQKQASRAALRPSPTRRHPLIQKRRQCKSQGLTKQIPSKRLCFV